MLSPNALNRIPAYLEAAEDLRHNPGQWKAYESQGNCVILAGPGSGKTKTVTIKVARMLADDVREPRGLACITYNNECARELKRRFARLGVAERPNLSVGTVHSFSLTKIVLPYAKAAHLDLPSPLSIASPSEQDQLFESAVTQKIGPDQNILNWRTQADQYRRTFLDRDSDEWHITDPTLSDLVESYEHNLRMNGQVDFDDMVLIGLKLVETHEWVRRFIRARFPILVVDEYQDLGLPLHRMVLSLLTSGVRLLAVGDPDQSIYGFTGARPELLQDLSKAEGVSTIHLSTNYRCGKLIVRAGQVALGEDRGYDTPAQSPEGSIRIHSCPSGLTEQAQVICKEIIPRALEAKNRNLGDIAVLYPDRYIGDSIAQEAKSCNLPFIRVDQNGPYRRTPLTRWLEDCAQWCSGGWRRGRPSLSSLLKTWLSFNRSDSADDRGVSLRRELVAFLWRNRIPDQSLHSWLSRFATDCLENALTKQGTMRDECEALHHLIQACAKGGRIEDFTVASFAVSTAI
jgi:DNA helicase-2/ATP-dependent DNA helicase PcrA